MNLNDTFQYISTVIHNASPLCNSQGTGFFYNRLAPTDKQGPQWQTIEGTWLVTNRHVLISSQNGVENAPSSITFYFRKINSGQMKWEPIVLSNEELEKRARFHVDKRIDVGLIDIHNLWIEGYKQGSQYTQCYAVSKDNFAGKNNIEVEASSDVLVIGYPRGFYDKVNLYPIIKSGIIASRWGADFQGERYFVIDAKLFPGSSGSIVVSKPIDFVVKNGKIMLSKEKQFAFLGIFSGEPFTHDNPIELDDMIIIQKSSYNLGVVWYGELVEDIIDQGVPLSQTIEV